MSNLYIYYLRFDDGPMTGKIKANTLIEANSKAIAKCLEARARLPLTEAIFVPVEHTDLDEFEQKAVTRPNLSIVGLKEKIDEYRLAMRDDPLDFGIHRSNLMAWFSIYSVDVDFEGEHEFDQVIAKAEAAQRK